MNERPDYRTGQIKAITRTMIVETARHLRSFGPVKEMAYIGMGGLEFVDFSAIYEGLGISRMHSSESVETFDRVVWNRPLSGIEVYPMTVGEALPDIRDLDVVPRDVVNAGGWC
jgi:hypothetical protein